MRLEATAARIGQRGRPEYTGRTMSEIRVAAASVGSCCLNGENSRPRVQNVRGDSSVADRAVPGHWEGDLVMGKGGRSAIGTLVERSSRYMVLLHLPNGRTADHVRRALTRQLSKLPAELRRTLTWDQGKEMAAHAQFTIDTHQIAVFFCDPHSPWQRGSNENSNGLLRQYFPKTADLSVYTRAELHAVTRQLNNRPRETLGWMKPSEVFSRFVASTS